MPYHALVVSKSRALMVIQILVSLLWLSLIAYYILDIPEGENGFVIVGMLFSIPIFCLISQSLLFAIHWLISKIARHFKELKEIGT